MWTRDSVLARLAAHDIPAGNDSRERPGGRRSNEDADMIERRERADRMAKVRGEGALTPAAVLVPLVNRPEGVTVLLTKRTEHLNNHAGQISFPGGRVDKTDRDPRHTALRETHEEIGLHGDIIDVVGQLDEYVVGTGFLVNPFVGFIDPPFELAIQEDEVAEVFEAPLSFVLDPGNIERHAMEFNGTKRHVFAITWNDYYIWGATAGMLRDLSQRVWTEGNFG